jgi:hypothetical protein
MKDFLRRLTRNQKRILLIVGALVLVSASVVGGMLVARQINRVYEPEAEQEAEEDEVAQETNFAPLTGARMAEAIPENSPVIAVMIPNSTTVRNQSGLVEAEIVYEAIANAGVPRLLAIYQANRPAVIGPVRSMRMHYIDWGAPYQAALAHSGAADYVLQVLRSQRNIGDGSGVPAGTYTREPRNNRPYEYTLYTSFERLLAASRARGFTTSNFTAWSRSDEPTAGQVLTSTTPRVELTMGAASNNVTYDWNAASGTWLRSVGGQPHMDREKGRIAPSVVIAMRVQSRTVGTHQEDITTSGTGEAVIFQNGQVIPARWSKENRDAPLRFFDMRNEEVILARGQTWVTAVPNNNRIHWR